MPNMFISLDVPRGEGVGVPAIVSTTGHPKTFVLAGSVSGGRYVVEGSNDGGNSWDILVDDDGTQALFISANSGAIAGSGDDARAKPFGQRHARLPAFEDRERTGRAADARDPQPRDHELRVARGRIW